MGEVIRNAGALGAASLPLSDSNGMWISYE